MPLPQLSRAGRVGGLGLLSAVLGTALVGTALVGPVDASSRGAADARRAPVQRAVVTCVGPDEALEFGGASVQLVLSRGWLAEDDFFVLVPVADASGLDAGERTTADRRERSATVVVPADGRALTPASTVEVRRGGEVLQRVPVAAGCGVLDPAPERGPVLGPVSSTAGAVSVQLLNASSVPDEIGVTLFPVGGASGESRFLTLAPGATGTVGFSGVAAGSYTLEAFGYTTFVSSTSAPFVVG